MAELGFYGCSGTPLGGMSLGGVSLGVMGPSFGHWFFPSKC